MQTIYQKSSVGLSADFRTHRLPAGGGSVVKAMENRDRVLLTPRRAKVGLWIRMVSPRLIDNIAKKAIQEKESDSG
jgi:hypothetical protein